AIATIRWWCRGPAPAPRSRPRACSPTCCALPPVSERACERKGGHRDARSTVTRREEVTAIAPASIANVAVGFDILGHTIRGPADRVTVRRIDDPAVRIAAIRGVAPGLDLDAARNTAGCALISLRDALRLAHGFEIEIEKGIPLGSGLGGS